MVIFCQNWRKYCPKMKPMKWPYLIVCNFSESLFIHSISWALLFLYGVTLLLSENKINPYVENISSATLVWYGDQNLYWRQSAGRYPNSCWVRWWRPACRLLLLPLLASPTIEKIKPKLWCFTLPSCEIGAMSKVSSSLIRHPYLRIVLSTAFTYAS